MTVTGSCVGTPSTISGLIFPISDPPSVDPPSVDPPSLPVPVFALVLNLELSSLGNWTMPETIIATKATTSNAAAAVVTLTQVGESLSQTGRNEYFLRPERSLVETATGKSPSASTSCK